MFTHTVGDMCIATKPLLTFETTLGAPKGIPSVNTVIR